MIWIAFFWNPFSILYHNIFFILYSIKYEKVRSFTIVWRSNHFGFTFSYDKDVFGKLI